MLTEDYLAQIQQAVASYRDVNDIFFIGRGLDWSIALEGSLKLKEISYIHAEAYAAGELKHGTLALVTEKRRLWQFVCRKVPMIRQRLISKK